MPSLEMNAGGKASLECHRSSSWICFAGIIVVHQKLLSIELNFNMWVQAGTHERISKQIIIYGTIIIKEVFECN